MNRFFPLLAFAALTACAQVPGDRALCGGKPVDGLTVTVGTEQASGIPGMTLRSVAFINSGTSPVSIDAIETSRIQVKAPEVWTFQPSSTGERKDWAFPVKDGFSQRNYLGMNDPD